MAAKGKAGGQTTRRVAIVAGLRTPFVKANGVFGKLTALDLGKTVVSELVARTNLDRDSIDLLVYGQVVPSVSAPNIAREIVLGTGLPQEVDAWSVSRACATSVQSFVSAADQIALGNADVAIAGGAECLSDIPFTVSRPLADALVAASRARDISSKLKSFAHLSARDLLPIPPALKEPSTGLTMGESAEKMAQENGISREAQDRFAKRSHDNAAKAWAEGKYAQEVMHVVVPPRYTHAAAEDDFVRKDTALEKMAQLKPVFDRRYGTITAANASGLTDGASALLLMSEEKAKALGYEPLGYLRSYAFTALDPKGQMLLGPAFATPKALDRAGLTLQEMDVVEIHEAFAAVVLSILQAFESKKFAEERLGRSEAVGSVDESKLNVNGGSIALGHPFAATGARMILSTLNELKRRDRQFGLVTLCAAGGLGAATVLERQ
ncbi:acetyl-CoA C-acyltransferase FadI [Vulgatibacter sp.]|uniref:acetyl-CoA C-acyltransferase FadI n=1 Tax=Vulgatibacter sp. TaxID=1971226 RepID=UPI0035632A3B